MYVKIGNKSNFQFNQVGWNDKTKDVNIVKDMVENSQIVVTAWYDIK